MKTKNKTKSLTKQPVYYFLILCVMCMGWYSFSYQQNGSMSPATGEDEGEDIISVLHVGKNKLNVKIESEKWTLFEYEAAPHSSVPYHYYKGHDKIYMVKEGTLSLKVNDTIVTIQPGEDIAIPRGTKHSYLNNSDEKLVMDVVMSPGNIIKQFYEMDAYFKNLKGKPEMKELVKITQKYGNISVGPPLNAAELEAQAKTE